MKLWFRRFATLLCKIFCNAWFRIQVIGEEHIPTQGAFVITANHRSLYDPVLVGICTKRSLCYMAKEELFERKFFAFILKNLGVFPVNRQSGGGAAISYAIELLQQGKPLGLFPEGTRSNTRRLLPFKAGVLLMVRKADVPMIPCAISIPPGNPFRGNVTVHFGEPMYYHELVAAPPTAFSPRSEQENPSGEKPKVTLKHAATLLRQRVIDLLPPGDHPEEPEDAADRLLQEESS